MDSKSLAALTAEMIMREVVKTLKTKGHLRVENGGGWAHWAPQQSDHVSRPPHELPKTVASPTSRYGLEWREEGALTPGQRTTGKNN